jgi:hypothetical protein
LKISRATLRGLFGKSGWIDRDSASNKPYLAVTRLLPVVFSAAWRRPCGLDAAVNYAPANRLRGEIAHRMAAAHSIVKCPRFSQTLILGEVEPIRQR